MNLYGSTEIAGDVTCWASDEIPLDEVCRDGWVTIGKVALV